MVRLDIPFYMATKSSPLLLFCFGHRQRGVKVDHLCPLATVVTKRGGGLWHHLSATYNRVLRSIYKQSSHHSHLDLCDVPVIAKWNTSQRIHTLARATSATTSPLITHSLTISEVKVALKIHFVLPIRTFIKIWLILY